MSASASRRYLAYVILLPQADGSGIPIVLIVEAIALAPFFSFWVVQGVGMILSDLPLLRKVALA